MGRKSKFTREQLISALNLTGSIYSAAAYLGISWSGFKYAASLHVEEDGRTLYQCWYKPKHAPLQLTPLDEMLSNVNRKIPRGYLRQLLVDRDMIDLKCWYCGYNQQRLDGLYPLNLWRLNHDPLDNNLSNLAMICFNCEFQQGGRMYSRSKKISPGKLLGESTGSEELSMPENWVKASAIYLPNGDFGSLDEDDF